MPGYTVTLTHKEKVDITATSPEAALKAAFEETKNYPFIPKNWAVKELIEEEEEEQL